MAVLFIGCAVAGILLGLRYNVLALVPANLIATVAIALMGNGLRVIVFTAVETVVLLQLGYLGGCVLRAMFVHIRLRKRLRDESARSTLAHWKS